MKVKQLIELLQAVDQDKEVVIDASDDGWYTVSGINTFTYDGIKGEEYQMINIVIKS